MWWFLLSILLINHIYCQVADICKSDPNAEAQIGCVPTCQPTCANPEPQVCTDTCIIDGCTCNSGYILDKPGGKCIKIEDCPKNLGCNGDSNATISSCVSSCPPTCKSNGKNCNASTDCNVGCKCNQFYILYELGGKCIKKTNCL